MIFDIFRGDKFMGEDEESLHDVNKNNEIVSKTHLYKNQKKIRETQIEILTALENGIQTEVKNNSKELKKLSKKVDNMEKKVQSKKSYQEGKWGLLVSSREIIAWVIAVVLSILKIIEYL